MSGIRMIVFGSILFLLGAVGVPVVMLMNLFSAQKTTSRFIVPGEHRVVVNKKGDYYVWDDYKSEFNNKTYLIDEALPVGLIIPIKHIASGETVPFKPDQSMSTTVHDEASRSIGYFRLKQHGEYIIKVEGDITDRVFSFQKAMLRGFLLNFLVSIAIGFLLGIGGIVMGIVGFVKLIKPKPGKEKGRAAA